MKRLGLHVERKPSGRPLLMRSELERVLGAGRMMPANDQQAQRTGRNGKRRPARHLMTEAEALATDPTAELIPGTEEARHVIEHGHACIAPRRVESPQAGAVAAHQARDGCERDDRA